MTKTTQSIIDEEHFSVTRTVLIHAARSAVWAALTQPALIAQWFGQTATLGELVVGGTGEFGWVEYDNFAKVLITAVEHERTFAYRWATSVDEVRSDNSTEVTFTLADADGGTLLTVIETGFDRVSDTAAGISAELDDHRDGWDSELDELVVLLESSSE
jgi:uncharacterized protein YndB with AHSA1/START domain